MTKLNRYIFWQLFVGMALVAATLSCVVWLIQSLRFVDMIVNRGLSAGMFVYLTGLMIPNFLTIILPIALFAIVTFTYHRMIIDRELVVMRAAGLGPIALSKAPIILAALTVAVGYLLSLHLVPSSYAQFREMQWDIRYSFSHVMLREGTFNDVAQGVTVYVRQRTKDGQLVGILAQDDRDEKRSFTLMSERGAMVQSEQGAKVIMLNGSRQDFDKETKQLSILYFDRYVFDMPPPANATDIRFQEPRERSMAKLIDLDTSYLDEDAIGKFKVELHRRLALPMSALGFTFIALACLLSGSFSRRGQGKRVLAAVLLAAVYQAVLMTILNAAASNLSLVYLIYILTIAPIAGGLLVLMKPNLFSLPRAAVAGRAA